MSPVGGDGALSTSVCWFGGLNVVEPVSDQAEGNVQV